MSLRERESLQKRLLPLVFDHPPGGITVASFICHNSEYVKREKETRKTPLGVNRQILAATSPRVHKESRQSGFGPQWCTGSNLGIVSGRGNL